MLFAVLFNCFARLNFSYFQKCVDFFMTTISFGVFVFGSFGVYPGVVSSMGARKRLKICLMLLVVLSSVFLRLSFSYFQNFVDFFMTKISFVFCLFSDQLASNHVLLAL